MAESEDHGGAGAATVQDTTESFLNMFADAEKALKRKLKRKESDRAGIGQMIDKYLQINPLWAEDAAQLRHFASVRNLLIHERSISDGYPVLIRANALRRLQEILSRLKNPEPVLKRFRRTVETVQMDDAVAGVLRLAYEKEFSQLPVLNHQRFRGLLTENGIARWLGRYVKNRSNVVDLSQVRAGEILEEEEKESGRQGQVFAFVQAETAVDEVIGMFAARPMLEVVLITERGGTGTAPILGIITQWDASRFHRHTF